MLVRTALVIAIASCALTGSAKVTPVNFPDGSRAWRIDCSITGPNECANEARRLCPAGYQPVEPDSRTLTVRCRADDSPTQPLPDYVAQAVRPNGVTAGQRTPPPPAAAPPPPLPAKPMPPARNEPRANQPSAGAKIYFKDDFGHVYEVDPSEAEKARRLGLVPTAEVDAARKVSARAKSRPCALPKGAYVASYGNPDGTCGYIDDNLFTWENPGYWQVPTGCTGDIIAASDRCTVVMDFRCPNKMRTVTRMFWLDDGSSALATEQRSLDGKCASKYEVHYTRK